MPIDPTPIPPPRRRRRRLALSLRGLMVLVLIVGGLMGWKARRASIQRRAIAVIEAAGGGVIRDYEQVDSGDLAMAINPGAPPPGPAWLRRWLGPEYFGEVTMVLSTFRGLVPPAAGRATPTPAEAMAAVAALDHLLVLDASFARARDADLAPLAGHRTLGTITLHEGHLADAGLATLATLPRLEVVDLDSGAFEAKFTGAGLATLLAKCPLRQVVIRGLGSIESRDLAPLARLDRLELLRLDRSPPADDWLARLPAPGRLIDLQVPTTAVTDATLARFDRLGAITCDGRRLTDAGLAHLGRLATLTVLDIGEAPAVTDVGLAHLAAPNLTVLMIRRSQITGHRPPGTTAPPAVAMPNLTLLNLSHAPLADAALAEFVAWPRLSTLWLADVPLTDDALPALGASPRPRMITLRGTRLTPAGIDRLRAARPTLAIDTEVSRQP